LELGLMLAAREESTEEISITVDNQASIKALADPKPSPERYLSDRILKAHVKAKRNHPHTKITIRWISGHKGISGNEKADIEAKKA
ncbi:hypothetical protein P691DRAFT_619515, partial [Macrolepiota fuliginosa MF-IS2]